VHASKQLASASLLGQILACVLCELVSTNPSHDDELAVLRVDVLHLLLKWRWDDIIVVIVIVTKITLAGRVNNSDAFFLYDHSCLCYLLYVLNYIFHYLLLI
jgi:hypothetical protein